MQKVNTITDNVQEMKRKIDQLMVHVDVGEFYIDVSVGELYINVQVGEFMVEVNVGDFYKTLKELEIKAKDTPQSKTVESLSANMRELASGGKKEKTLLLNNQNELRTILHWLNAPQVKM